MGNSIAIELLTGKAIATVLTELAELRIRVFREYPYLYEGSVAYEQNYLADYAKHQGACCVVAKCDGIIVGASTAMWLHEAGEAFAKPFCEALAANKIYYFAESVLLPEFRGQGIGHQFFDQREAHAEVLGAQKIVFCAVDRPNHHPLKPQNYQDLAPFWQKRGYHPLPNRKAYLEWQDIDRDVSELHSLTFWTKDSI